MPCSAYSALVFPRGFKSFYDRNERAFFIYGRSPDLEGSSLGKGFLHLTYRMVGATIIMDIGS